MEISKTPFYFLRHAETDHNLYKIYDEFTEKIQLNENGKKQALQVQRIFSSISIATVCSSPLLRVQQTKEIILENKPVEDIILDEFCECSSSLWQLFLAAETGALPSEEWAPIHEFTQRVKTGLEKALQYTSPMLLVAHGGTYWALAHLLDIQGDRKIGNCDLRYIIPDTSGIWKAEPINV